MHRRTTRWRTLSRPLLILLASAAMIYAPIGAEAASSIVVTSTGDDMVAQCQVSLVRVNVSNPDLTTVTLRVQLSGRPRGFGFTHVFTEVGCTVRDPATDHELVRLDKHQNGSTVSAATNFSNVPLLASAYRVCVTGATVLRNTTVSYAYYTCSDD